MVAGLCALLMRPGPASSAPSTRTAGDISVWSALDASPVDPRGNRSEALNALGAFAGTIEDEQLLLDKHGFSHHGAGAAGTGERIDVGIVTRGRLSLLCDGGTSSFAGFDASKAGLGHSASAMDCRQERQG
jgi:hypothetical protein